MSEPFLGEIRAFGFNFAPRGWASCNGQLLPINQNQALFALLGTIYGGNGQTTFALPDLRGRVPINQGQSSGASTYSLGQAIGVENVTLLVSQIPAHTHRLNASPDNATTTDPGNNLLAVARSATYASSGSAAMNPGAIAITGGSQPHENRQPYLTVNYCIALQGIFPSRN